MKVAINKSIRDEKGQALILVMILMVVGGLIVAPLLSYMYTGLKAGQKYEFIAHEFYAADAGVADGLWQIKSDNLETLFSTYDLYDYNSEWKYDLAENVNNTEVDVTIKNIWIPKDITQPTNPDYVRQLIRDGKLMVTGNTYTETTWEIKIYYSQEDSDPPLAITKLGIWLPPGFSYDTNSDCTLETWLDDKDKDYSRVIIPHCGGEAVTWTLTDVLFTDLPEVDTQDYPLTSIINFKFTSTQPGRTPEAISWITTSGVGDIPYTWDADVKVYYISSEAGGDDGTIIDAYAIKTDLRELGLTIEGDYRAIGDTLMTEGSGHGSNPFGIRYELLDYSDSVAGDIPDNAEVKKAFLYWSAWVEETGGITLFFDDCSNLDNGNWYYGSDWHEDWWTSAFQAHHYYHGGRELEMVDTTDLSSYAPESVTVSWQNWLYYENIESEDCFQYALHNSSGWGSWNTVWCNDYQIGTSPKTFTITVPNDYLTSDFKIKFQITGFSDRNEYCYFDNFTISVESDTIADTSVIFKINGTQVCFDEFGNPITGFEEITADQYQVRENYDPYGGPEGFSYSCKKDVTELLKEFANQGNGTYTVGGVYGDTGSQWSYAGWSLVIVYESTETKRHQLYLFDDFYYIAPHTEGLKFSISGFLVPDPIPGEVNAAKITCFVGDGDACYSGDFIAINAPDVPGDQIPDSYKLWDSIALTATWFYPYMANTNGSPNNVWNSQSIGLSASGIDIDTFYVPWGEPPSEGLIKPGDSSAEITLNYAGLNPIGAELIDFIYIIISFRSRTTMGGTITYLLR
jgi:hypothetical protein